MYKWFPSTAGFLISCCIFIGSIFFDFYAAKWSGNSPLNRLYFLPINASIYLVTFLLITKLKIYEIGRPKKLVPDFFFGFLSGILLFGAAFI